MPIKYKIVRRPPSGELTSAMVYGEYALFYEEGYWTTAKIGGILVLKDMPSVEQYISLNLISCKTHELWEASCVRPIRLGYREIRLSRISENELKWLWKRTSNHPYENYGWPIGTQAYKSIRLIRQVPIEEVGVWR